MSRQAFIAALTELAGQSKPSTVVEAASEYSLEAHKNMGIAFSKAQRQFKQAAIKYHRSSAKIQMVGHKKHTKLGNASQAADCLKAANRNTDKAEAIKSGKLMPMFHDPNS